MWDSLIHKGPVLCSSYKYQGYPFYIKGKLTKVSPLAEENMFYFNKINKVHKSPIFKRNFWKGYSKFLSSKCSLGDIQLIINNDYKPNCYGNVDDFKYIKVNGKTKEINPCIEPPGIFVGRGLHPLSGTIKKRISVSDIIVNGSTVHGNWKNKVKNKGSNWICCYRDPIQNSYKYISFKEYINDKDKFDKANKLMKKLNNIRKLYEQYMYSKDTQKKQLGFLIYFLDTLAIRVGSDKYNRTQGLCNLTKNNFDISPKSIKLHFIGKDHVPYETTIPNSTQHFGKLKQFLQHSQHNIFTISYEQFKEFLKSNFNVTPKVFRTCKASYTFDKLLNKYNSTKHGCPVEYYKKCNREIAILCNHKSSKGYLDNTSKVNYLDPRISVKWCRKVGCRLDKIFTDVQMKQIKWCLN